MRRSVKHTLIVGAVVVGGLLLGSAAQNNTYNLGKNIEILVNLFRNLNLFYVDGVEPDKLMDAAAEGMTKVLDPYTTYLSAEKMEEFSTMTTGKYGGVGSMIRQRGEWVDFIEPYKGSPADKAGIRPDDRIVEIEGKDAKGMTSQKVSDLLRGDPGSTVRLKVKKFPGEEVVELRIKRERITIPSIPYYGMVADSVGYIIHNDFTEDCSTALLNAYRDLEAQGMKALVLDYRGNGGGLLQEAVKILSMFVPKGTEVVSMRSTKSAKENRTFKTENEPVSLDMPMVVLTNSGSASAAEIVAGALQDTDRAVIVGQRTFGKGLVQSTYPLGYDAYAKITTAKYYLPSGRCVQAIDYAHRNDDGSVASVPDSLVQEFKTLGGRKVYDGGGVVPDVKLDPQYISTFAYVVYGMGHIDDFLTDYCRRHYDDLVVEPQKYHFDQAAYEEFIEFMKDKDVPWESEAELRWKEFKKAAEKERWGESIDTPLAQIDDLFANTTEDNLRLYQREISDMIEEQIVSRYCFNEGGIHHTIPIDTELAKAVEILQNKPLYTEIVTSRDTERK
ncbi:MAG: S41 family peptidase [Rikenellaceae bacterium]|nr:S41 family peptidase [Rikenellaceae bacterium]